MKVVILAGGLGTRLAEETEVRPKPMVTIGGRPILWHIMKHYSQSGFKDFVVALGYKGDVIKRYFMDYVDLNGRLTLSLKDRMIERHDSHPEDWRVDLVDTGIDTATGGRLKRLRCVLADGSFMMTYGDGVSNVDVCSLLRFHRRHGRLVTLTAVRPPARFGGLEFDGTQVIRFSEKPQTGEGWINGGFFVLEPRVLDYIDDDQMPFEREPLERLVEAGQVMAYRHDAFWQCMDTLRDKRLLDSMWEKGEAPWKTWN
jgi:glucose-1-phosphate cytidylyltransferase